MSSDTAVPTGTVTRCGWPECPSSFTAAPMARGWTKILLSALKTDVNLVLCPFHAVGHVPHMEENAGKVMALCSCRAMIPCEQGTMTMAYLDWRQHAREVNSADMLVTCQECLRGFEPTSSGRVRRHNAWDKMRGRLMSHVCPGAGLAPYGLEKS